MQAGEISSKVSTNGVISAINQTAESIKIHANRISLEGIITANGNIKILEDGSIEAKNGKFNGLITGDNTTIDGLVRVNAQFINTNPNSYLLNYIAYSKRVNGSDPVNYPSKGFGIFDGSIKLAELITLGHQR